MNIRKSYCILNLSVENRGSRMMFSQCAFRNGILRSTISSFSISRNRTSLSITKTKNSTLVKPFDHLLIHIHLFSLFLIVHFHDHLLFNLWLIFNFCSIFREKESPRYLSFFRCIRISTTFLTWTTRHRIVSTKEITSAYLLNWSERWILGDDLFVRSTRRTDWTNRGMSSQERKARMNFIRNFKYTDFERKIKSL